SSSSRSVSSWPCLRRCRSYQACADPRTLHSFPTRRSSDLQGLAGRDAPPGGDERAQVVAAALAADDYGLDDLKPGEGFGAHRGRSEEHTSELQSRSDLVCRLLLEKKKNLASYSR